MEMQFQILSSFTENIHPTFLLHTETFIISSSFNDISIRILNSKNLNF